MSRRLPTAARLGDLSLSARLRAVPHRFTGLHALRLAELGHLRAGTDAAPGEEAVRLPVVQGLAFAPAPVAGATPDAHGTRLLVAFMGLTGPLGVLPQVYAELVQRADRLRNRSVSAFLDMFNHRLVSLFLRASEKYRIGLLVQREVSGPAPAGRTALGSDPASAALLALAGFGTPHLRGRMSVADEVVLYYAGIFAARTRPPGALQAMLADYLGMKVRVEPFSERWVAVAAAEQTRLPCAGEVPRYAALGIDTVAGARIRDVQGQFRVVVGPVNGEAMRSLMPDQPGLQRLVDLVRAYAGVDLGFDVQVILRADCVPALALTGDPGPAAPRLGWNSWAKFLPVPADKDDIILDPDQVMGWQSRAGAAQADLMERT